MTTPWDHLSDAEIERLYDAGCIPDAAVEQLARARLSPAQFARIDAFAYGLAALLSMPIDELANNVTRGSRRATFGTGDPMHAASIGADSPNYPEIAAHAIHHAAHRSPSPVYGYRHAGGFSKIYLFQTIEDASNWLVALVRASEPTDYAAVFAATDLSHPIPGLESYGHPDAPSAEVSGVLPFLLGLPLGAAGGYLLRRWQESNPDKLLPGLPPFAHPVPGDATPVPVAPVQTKSAGEWYDVDPIVGGWVDLVESAGPISANGFTIGTWYDIVGAQSTPSPRGEPQRGVSAASSPRRQAFARTRALIQSAIREVTQIARSTPAAAYVWSLDPPDPQAATSPDLSNPFAHVELGGTTGVMAFDSGDEALAYMRDRIQSPHVALALFNRSSHWPNPTNWTKSDDPAYASIIDQQIGVQTQTSGAFVGSVVDDVRARAQTIAGKRGGSVVGVIHTTRDGLWHALAFGDSDDADDWLGTATQDPSSFTYAAYYDKRDVQWPRPLNEKIGGGRGVSPQGTLDALRVATTSGRW